MTENNTIETTAIKAGIAVSIELSRGQRGTYGWTIKVDGSDADAVLALTCSIDNDLRARYNSETE